MYGSVEKNVRRISQKNAIGEPGSMAGRNMIFAPESSAGPEKYQKRIGSTTYVVSVHFSKTGKETAADILQRLITREAAKTA